MLDQASTEGTHSHTARTRTVDKREDLAICEQLSLNQPDSTWAQTGPIAGSLAASMKGANDLLKSTESSGLNNHRRQMTVAAM